MEYIIKPTKCSHCLSCSERKKKWESSVLAARGDGSYPITWVLYHQECICYLLGTDTGKALQIIPVNVNYIWHAVKSWDIKKLHRAPQRRADCAISVAGLWFPWGCGVNTGTPSSWLHTGGLWARQWPLCLLTFLFYAINPFQGGVYSSGKPFQPYLVGGAAGCGDKCCIWWVTAECSCLCCPIRQCTQ